MSNHEDKSLFIINSPFQCLCMFEAIEHYKIEDYDVILRPDSIERNNEMLEGVLMGKGIAYKRVKLNHIIKDVAPFLFKKREYYSHFFIGDYYSGGIVAYIYALIHARRGATITYLDDGTLTLNIFQTPPIPRTKNWKVASIVKMYELLKVVKGIGKPAFFTIFNVHSDKYKIEKNALQSLRKKIGDTEHYGVYIIGTNFYNEREGFLCMLSKVLVYLKKRYPAQKIYYCPHRRNLDNEELYQLLEKEDVTLYNTKVSVEYDFVEYGVNPKAIMAFGSTAAFTLKMIYPKSDVLNAYFMIYDEGYIKTFDTLAGELGVELLDGLE